MLETNDPYMFSPSVNSDAANCNTTNDNPSTSATTTTTDIDNEKNKTLPSIDAQNDNNNRAYRNDSLNRNGLFYNENNRHLPQQQQQRYNSNNITTALKRESPLFNNYAYNKPPTPISVSSSASISSPSIPVQMKYQPRTPYHGDSRYSQPEHSSGSRWFNGTTASAMSAVPTPPLPKDKDPIDGNIKSTTQTTTTTATTTATTTTTSTLTTTNNNNNKKSKRRKEMTKYMESINQDFLKTRERIFLEKLESVRKELTAAYRDQHPVYTECLRDLERKRKKTIEEFALFRQYQIKVTDRQFQLEIYQAEEEYTAEKQEVREKLFNMLEEKRRRLKEEKDNCDLAYDVMLESQSRAHKRTLRKRGADHIESKSSKKKQASGPALVCALKEEDILADLQAMQQGISLYDNASNADYHTSSIKKNIIASNKKK